MRKLFCAVVVLTTFALATASGPEQPAKSPQPGKAIESDKPVIGDPSGVAPKQPEVLKL
jgi:hypothetical protein